MKIFYDVDTQHDFMDKKGALYVPGAEDIKENIAKLSNYAWENSIPIIASVDKHFGTEEYKHREGEMKKWGGPFPDHCMAGTKGQEKIEQTKRFWHLPTGKEMELAIYIPHDLENKVHKEQIKSAIALATHYPYDGVFFEKQSYDVFTNPAFEAFLKKADVTEAVVYGVATDYCVKAAVLGMQQRGIQCYVVSDAIAAVSPDIGEKSLEEMVKSGAKLITTKEVIDNKMNW
jgi:nicotinamidase/pyrazinamidase